MKSKRMLVAAMAAVLPGGVGGRATQIARTTQGVAGVRNDIIVRA